ncbi:hypothetical protein [Flavobacterium luteum]|uniref:N-6 DNA methylase n=1 Tax=Flavobacterium luteum TaxID=2026654 RepID=A0A7J5A8A9_9FLAO|nr:hypothetical protein [Flavobacterium luteum]KAB1153755.1 hypothetical protein F6464_13900 [Flavobacterium luteum]
MRYKNIREEELKNKVGADWFKQFDTTEIIGNIDFTVFPQQDNLFGRTPLLWAEAKTGNFDVATMFVQLILTIGKARTFDKTMPPAFLGAFDFKKVAFVPYINIQDIFYLNDFNWNVTPSNHETKEFQLIKQRIESTLKQNTYVYDYQKDEKELQAFIKNNVAKATTTSKLKIDKNNFIPIYLRWLEIVKPIIDVNWDDLNKANILDSDFYLADLFVDDKDTQNIGDDLSIRENLFVMFQNEGYKIAKENLKQMFDANIMLKNKDTYLHFWKRYKRPPLKEFQDYIIERRDLLVPQDIRERKGAFFTPRIWVELSQKYLTDYLGENWQDEYYIWDCAAGTGNLLAGLTNKYNIYASTLDQADVNVMHERIDHGANLLKNNVFQFDFLNDDFSKLPDPLQFIINNPEKRKKLVIYINPPYAEADNRLGDGRSGVAESMIHKKYSNLMGYTKREMYIQFFTRIHCEIPGIVLANFSTLKNLQAPKFSEFRDFFQAKLEKLFITPADTFDNVKGQFPIGFFIWNLNKKERFNYFEADVFNKREDYVGPKNIWAYDNFKLINEWVKTFRYSKGESIATIIGVGSDFQNQRLVRFGKPFMKVPASNHNWQTTKENLIETSIYYTVRHIFDSTWLNDRDQFLYPNENWESDKEFQNNCLVSTLFSNNISSSFGTNHWIPFTEYEVNAQAKFESNFMTHFIKGKIKQEVQTTDLFTTSCQPELVSGSNEMLKRVQHDTNEGVQHDTNKGVQHDTNEGVQHNKALVFSEEATAVFDAGRELWKYYHAQKDVNVNASLYDIREYFQGRNDKGRMNSKSNDATYSQLIANLRSKLSVLADKIKPKVYEYGFLKA